MDLQIKHAFLENSGLAFLGLHFCMASHARGCVPTVSPHSPRGSLRLPTSPLGHQNRRVQNSELFFASQGGSSGRGTALRGGCDAELVLFLNCFKSYEDQGVHRAEILHEMRVLLESWWQKPIPGLSFEFPEQDAARVLRFRLASTDLENWMDVSLVPAFDALGEGCLTHSRVGGKILRSRTGLPVLTLPPACCVAWASLSGLSSPDYTH